MPPPRKKRNCEPGKGKGKAANGSGQVSAQVNQQINNEIVTEDGIDDIIENTGPESSQLSDGYNQSDIPIKIEGYTLTESGNGTGNQEAIRSSQPNEQSEQLDIPIKIEGYTLTGSGNGTCNQDFIGVGGSQDYEESNQSDIPIKIEGYTLSGSANGTDNQDPMAGFQSHAQFVQTDFPIKIEGYTVSETGRGIGNQGQDCHDVNAGCQLSQPGDETSQADISIKLEGYTVTGNETQRENYNKSRQSHSASYQPMLPDKVLKKILNSIENLDRDEDYTDYDHFDRTAEALLKSRLVCVHWNRIIEDTPELMKKIPFPVRHAIPFLQLPLVKKGKVTSIIINKSLTSKQASKLMDVIGNTAEKVEFAFEDTTSKVQQKQLFLSILQQCKNLQELVINGHINRQAFLTQQAQTSGFRVNANMYMEHRKIELTATNTIRFITIIMNQFDKKFVANGLVQILLLLPKLEKIDLYGCDEDTEFGPTILSGLCKYIEKYKADLHLKKLTMHPDGCAHPIESDRQEFFELLVSLLILCTKHEIHFTEIPFIHFNKFLALKKSRILPSLQQRPIFNAKVNGILKFGDQPLRNLDILHSLNIRKLRLDFNITSIAKNDISWMREIKPLHRLELNCRARNINNANLQPSIPELELILSEGLSTIADVRLAHNILDPIHAFRWSQYFPNLKVLGLSFYKTMPTDLISQLTSFQFLSKLILDSLPCLDDSAFTNQQANRFTASNGAAELAPAIACFQLLSVLHVRSCHKLTDACIINGIAHCKTLKELWIIGCGNIKYRSRNLVCFERVIIH